MTAPGQSGEARGLLVQDDNLTAEVLSHHTNMFLNLLFDKTADRRVNITNSLNHSSEEGRHRLRPTALQR